MTPLLVELVLPLGISFYTFQTVSYTIDVYKKKLSPCTDLLNFSLYVSFFPQLVAGPIERAKKLLPQIEGVRELSIASFKLGCWLIFWGLFKKVVIADNLAPYNFWGATHLEAMGIDLWIAGFAFCIRFYCDFSGYSDIAIGLAKVMGFNLSQNFNLPYFATNPGELWRRWHITMTHWFRDYVYSPLSKKFSDKKGKRTRN